DSTMAALFRAALINRAGQLGETLRHETDAVPAAGLHEVADLKDVAEQSAIAEVDEAQAAQAASELDQVRAALRRIDNASYGECIECGKPIDLRRLQAVPVAAYCAACQSGHERSAARV